MINIDNMPVGSVAEVDNHDIPEWIKNMTMEELIAEEKRLEEEMDKTRTVRSKKELSFKTLLDLQ